MNNFEESKSQSKPWVDDKIIITEINKAPFESFFKTASVINEPLKISHHSQKWTKWRLENNTGESLRDR